jgi:hypothetical protein
MYIGSALMKISSKKEVSAFEISVVAITCRTNPFNYLRRKERK